MPAERGTYVEYLKPPRAFAAEIRKLPTPRRFKVFLVDNRKTGRKFRQFQASRNGKPLAVSDYSKLVEVWKHTPLLLTARGKQETIVYPATAPRSWWKSLAKVLKSLQSSSRFHSLSPVITGR